MKKSKYLSEYSVSLGRVGVWFFMSRSRFDRHTLAIRVFEWARCWEFGEPLDE